jgi:hypothetical protein
MRGLEQARDERPWTMRVFFAVPIPERESWYLCAFTARDGHERSALEAATARIGFDPAANPERLSSKGPNNPRDCKRALEELTQGKAERAHDGLDALSLVELERRGANNGLRQFLLEVRNGIVPLLTGRTAVP